MLFRRGKNSLKRYKKIEVKIFFQKKVTADQNFEPGDTILTVFFPTFTNENGYLRWELRGVNELKSTQFYAQWSDLLKT